MIQELPLRTFLNTQTDPEDVQEKGCVVLDNLELDNAGKLIIRKGKKVKAYLDEILCTDLIRCNTTRGKFFIGYDKNNKTYFRINKL